MRISLVAMSCSAPDPILRLANELAQGAEIHLFMPPRPDLHADRVGQVLLHPTWPTQSAHGAWRKLLAMGNPWVLAENAKRIRRVAPDLVHLLSPHPAHALLIPLLGTPSCLSLPDRLPRSETPASQTLRHFMIGRALGMVDHLLIQDPQMREALAQSGVPRERITLVPPGPSARPMLEAYRQVLDRLRAPQRFPFPNA